MSFNDYWQAQRQRRAVTDALATLKGGGADAQNRLHEALQRAVLLLPVAELPEGHEVGDVLVGQSVQLKVTMVKGPDDKLYLPCFTSEEHLRRTTPDEEPLFVLLPCAGAAHMALTSNVAGIILDRGGPHSAIIPPAMLQSLVASHNAPPPAPTTQSNQPARPSLRISPLPRGVTYAEIQRLNGWLQQQSGLVQAYLFGLVVGTNKPMLTVGMGFLQPPDKDGMEPLARAAGEILGQVGVILLDARLAALLARQAGAIRFDVNREEGGTQSE